MSGSPKEKLHTHGGVEEVSDEREVYLRNGRKLVVGEQGGDQLVEIRNESGMLEVRIRLTEQGPVLQMESARLSLKASEAVEIESKQVAIKASENVDVNAAGDVVVIGAMIHLNPDK
jgi:phage gp45-like